MHTFSIKKKDIESGKVKSPMNCPFAKAIKRTFPNFKNVRVFNGKVTLTENGKKKSYPLTKDVSNWIAEFDKTGTQKPFKIYHGKVPKWELSQSHIEKTR